MDGLVSTGNKFPYTILKINFFNQKIFSNYFINILNMPVDKRSRNHALQSVYIDYKIQLAINFLFTYFFNSLETLASQ